MAIALATLLVAPAAQSQQVSGSPMDVRWNNGARNCAVATMPPLQVHRFDAQTYILRESLCTTREGPFIYLLIGTRRAMLIDTGDVADTSKMPLVATVVGLLSRAGASRLPLMVVHTHGHLDHRSGDVQFKMLPNVMIAATDLDAVKRFFGLRRWPSSISQVNLGERVVDVIPTPGHYSSHVSYYDRRDALFFSGDFFMPGRLLIADKAADVESAQRVAEFIRNRPLNYVLGGHVELDSGGDTYTLGAEFHPHEHVLQLSKHDLLAFSVAVRTFNGFYTKHDGFVMANQNRILSALATAVLALLITAVLALRHFVRRNR